MTRPEQPSTRRVVGRRAVLRTSAVVGVGCLAGCVQPLLEEGNAAVVNGGDSVPADESGDNGDGTAGETEGGGVDVGRPSVNRRSPAARIDRSIVRP